MHFFFFFRRCSLKSLSIAYEPHYSNNCCYKSIHFLALQCIL
uniref:Uncharacterized protein n=1 Tax=Utricularia reniformis TaxID=192314 RepID=A0A1Y0B175_9LAMI|nr:hypothetical protein AEK19_MT0905 [Utricularia reniformis]ART31134.1 hypothetical protein AEK19_MT0905 [Utricularia reniformis]